MTVGYELKKVLFKKKMLVFIVAAILIKVLLLVFSSDKSFVVKFEKDGFYRKTIEQLSGGLTEEKEMLILEKYSLIDETETKCAEILNSYANGEISYDKFNSRLNACNEILENRKETEALYGQYLVVKKDSEHRYFTLQNGWNTLLSHDSPDFLLVVLVIIAVIPVFCMDSSYDMNGILKCCEKGRARLCISKILGGVIITAICVCAFKLCEIIFCALRYGLPDWSFPVQSISQYSSSGYEISLGTLVLIQLANRLFGFVYLALIVMFLSSLTEKSLPSAFFSLAVVILPYFVFSGVKRYSFPMPLGYMLSTGFLQGVVRNEAFLPEEKLIGKAQYAVNVLFSVLIMAVLVYLTVMFFLYRSPFKYNKKREAYEE